MPAQERRLVRGRQLARRALTSVGDDLRSARLGGGMTLAELSSRVGLSAAQLSRVERGLAARVPYESLVMIGAAVGLDISVRAFPNGAPVRDAAQLELLRRLRSLLPAGLRMRFEVPIGQPGDLRAWDAAIDGRDWSRPVEAESRLRDVQALQRRVRLKSRDARMPDVILLVADTRHNRHVLRVYADAFAEQFPIGSREALATLRAGRPPRGGAIVLG